MHDLTTKQHESLDRIADSDPDAVVIGWEETSKSRGPVVLMSDGRERVVNPNGYQRNPAA